MPGLTSIREAILAELEPIHCRRSELMEEDSRLAEEEGRLEGALKELDGEGAKRNKGKVKTSGKKKDSKTSVKKEHVQPVCLALVEANPGIERNDLAGLAVEKLKEHGFSSNGLTMQIGKCIKSKLFAIADDGTVSVASSGTVTPPVNGSCIESSGSKLPVESFGGFQKSR